MEYATDRITELPLQLIDTDEQGFTPLRRWRETHGINYERAAKIIGVSTATYYRYEAGFNFNMRKANEIVRMTNGEVRYRDLIAGFMPEYA